MKSATMRLIERVERLEMTGEIGDGTVAQLHDLAAMARLEQLVDLPNVTTRGQAERQSRYLLDQETTARRAVTRPCGAYACGDQMLCPCGLAWDIGDDDPPGCPRGGR